MLHAEDETLNHEIEGERQIERQADEGPEVFSPLADTHNRRKTDTTRISLMGKPGEQVKRLLAHIQRWNLT
jgi:hypothetical protein